MTDPLVLDELVRTLVQVSSTWTMDPGAWTTIDAWCEEQSDGLCNDIGSAHLFTPSGLVTKENGSEVNVVSLDICGKYVRVLEEDASGTILSADGVKFSPTWYGIVNTRTKSPDSLDLALENVYECSGMLSILDQITPTDHLEVGANPDDAARIGDPLVFNGRGSKRTGNRSAFVFELTSGAITFIFDRTNTGQDWTARQVIEYFLALAGLENPGGPTWTLAGQTTALDWSEKWDLNKMTVLEVLSRIMSPKVGITYYVTVESGNCVINVVSASGIDIVGDDYTLPANNKQVALDLTSDVEITSFDMGEAQGSTYDRISIKLARPWYCVTLLLSDFDHDWEEADEVPWLDLDPDSPERELGKIQHVFRRFKLKQDWSGDTYGGFTMPNTRVRSSASPYGSNGYTGDMEFDDGVSTPSGAAYKITKDLPIKEGYNWDTVDIADVDTTAKNMKPQVFVQDDGGAWTTLADYCGRESVEIEVDEDIAAITFGPAQVADYIQTIIDEGRLMIVTIGVEAALNSVVSWNRGSGTPRDQVRSFERDRTHLGLVVLTSGTVVRLDTGSLAVAPEDITIKDDLPLARNVLAVSTAWYSKSDWTITWVNRGTAAKDSQTEVGTMYLTASHLEANGATTTETVYGLITKRVRSFKNGGTVKVTTKRMQIDVEAVL